MDSDIPLQNSAAQAASDARPFWSIMIPTYNADAAYLRETLESVLSQASPVDQMHIEIVDDSSPQGDIVRLASEIAGDRVSVFRNPNNVGLARNWNTCIERARGTWVHILHQDDKVLPGFYQRLREGIENRPAVEAAFCRHAHMNPKGHWIHLSPLERDDAGILDDFIEKIAVLQCVQCPSIVVKKSLYDRIGLFATDLVFSMDWEMWRRIACNTRVWYEPNILALYRLHPASATPRLERTGENILDIGKSIEKVRAYLPTNRADWLSSKARENYAAWGFTTARKMLSQGDFDGAKNQVKAALKLSKSKKVLRMLLSYERARFSRWVGARKDLEA
jgi:glycosyltransferase involved in cell wall biosynthesis